MKDKLVKFLLVATFIAVVVFLMIQEAKAEASKTCETFTVTVENLYWKWPNKLTGTVCYDGPVDKTRSTLITNGVIRIEASNTALSKFNAR